MAKVVFLLHGIRTQARWQRAFADVASNHGWQCPLDGWWYGRFSVFQFLTPLARRTKVGWFRSRYTAALKEHQRVISASSNRLPSIVAHSFGTYILGYAQLKYKDIKFDKVILCGSILPRDFPWQELIDRGQVNAVRNDVGLQDVWTEFSSWVVPGTGAAGRRGFRNASDRLFQHEHNLSHSEVFDSAWMDQNWFPFLEQSFPPLNKNVDATKAIALPRGDRPRAAATISSLVLLTYLAVAASLLFLVWRIIHPPVYSTKFSLKDLLTSDAIHTEFVVKYSVNGLEAQKTGSRTCVIEEPATAIDVIDVKCPGYTFSKRTHASGGGILWLSRVALNVEHPEDRPPRDVPLFQYVITPQNPLDDREIPFIPSDEQYAAAIEDQPAVIDGDSVQTFVLTCENKTDHSIDLMFFRWNKDVETGKAPPKWSYRNPPCPPNSTYVYEFLDKTRGYHFIYGSFCGRVAQYLAQGSLTQTGRPTVTIRMEGSSSDKLTADLTIKSPSVDAGGNQP